MTYKPVDFFKRSKYSTGYLAFSAKVAFLKRIEADYNRSLFDEHVTGTPTFYINELRYTGATDAESLVDAIVQPTLKDAFNSERPGGISGALSKLRRRGNSEGVSNENDHPCSV